MLSLKGTFSIEPISSSTQLGLSISQIGEGTAAGGQLNFNQIQIASDDVAGEANGLLVNHNAGGSSIAGGRVALLSNLNFTAQANASNPNRFYVGGGASVNAFAGDGGTDTGANSKGTFQGFIVQASNWAGQNITTLNGIEIDTLSVGAGLTSIKNKLGLQITQWGADAVAASSDWDSAIALTNQHGAVGWKNLILIGDLAGDVPLQTTGTILKMETPQTIGNGFDISAATITGNAFKSPNFVVTGTGSVGIGTTGPRSTLEVKFAPHA